MKIYRALCKAWEKRQLLTEGPSTSNFPKAAYKDNETR